MKGQSVTPQELINTWLISLGVWLVIAFSHLLTGHFDALSYQADKTLSLRDFLYYGSAYASWAILCTFLYVALKRFFDLGIKRLFFALGVVSTFIWLPLFFVYDGVVYAYFYELPERSASEVLAQTPKALIFLYTILALFCLVACTALIAYQRSKQTAIDALALAQKDAENALVLSQQKLQLLQSQLSPHFLFNCLSAISALVRTDDKDKLLSSVSRVGTLLRYATKASKEPMVMLNDELEFVNDYVALQSLRFAERFIFDLKLDIQTNNQLVIPLLLQPLIENTFKHGVAHTQEQVSIGLVISEIHSEQGKYLNIEVRNTYPCGSSDGGGSSIENLHDRLNIAYPSQHTISTSGDEDVFILKLCIPVTEYKRYD
ncbi:sensor histidine kinase [Ningiella sp. W23]|uniref:sensor histidine kinase n=1 Tax=Ningiella sp. W23 TaxID=3023715 RepID=UPI003757DAD9